MGVFQDMVEVVNRTSEPIDIMFDGQRHTLLPNYTADGQPIEGVRNPIPRQVVPYALNQTVILGSEAFTNPGSFKSKIGIIDYKNKGPKAKKHSWYDCSFFDIREETEITRVPVEQILDENHAGGNVKVIRRGKKQHSNMEAALDAPTTPFDVVAGSRS